ncbi:MAG: DinB family protein [Acidobacteria bacterium]|nr:DinB family protein [Acidobacteriota bacterium]
MNRCLVLRPQPGEYAPYHGRYIEKVPDGNLDEILEAQWEELGCLLEELDDEAAEFRYAEGKWSVKELLGHLVDAERIFAYRMLCVARGDQTPLPGFDENAYVAAANFDAKPLETLLEEYDLVRGQTLGLLRGMGEEELARRGTVNGNSLTARAIAFMLAGHELHHLGVLKEKYLPSF